MAKNSSSLLRPMSIGVSLTLMGAVFALYYWAVSKNGDERLLLEAGFFALLGTVFALSGRFSSHNLIFFSIAWLCRKFAVVGGQYQTLMYATIFYAAALWKFYSWVIAVQ